MGDEFVSNVWAKGLFTDKVVFCTGGSGDICSAQVKALVYLGGNAFIVGRNGDKARRVAKEIAAVRVGSRVLSRVADVRDLKSLTAAAEDCVQQLGGIDFVIAGAAGNFLAPMLQLSSNAFRTVVEIDLIGSWHALKATTPYLLDSVGKHGTSGGRIIFISSTTQNSGAQLVTHGAVAKAGVDALSAQVAIELGPRGITSNVIAPGPIAGTEGVKRLIEESTTSAKVIPRGRFGSLKDMGNAAVYLFSEAGDYANGSVLTVDGGAWRVRAAEPGKHFKYPEAVMADLPFSEVMSKQEYKL